METGITYKKRPITKEEINSLKARKSSFMDKVESFGIKLIGFYFLLFIFYQLFKKLIYDPSPKIENFLVIAMVILAIGFSIFMMKKLGDSSYDKIIEEEIDNGMVEILIIKTNKSVKRKDPEDFGIGFYLKLNNQKTLYLTGQLYDILEYERKIPSTEFEIIRTLKNKIFIDIRVKGNYFTPSNVIEPFTDEQYNNDETHYDGQILNIPIEEIT
jgi:hypothetical protein